MPNPEAKISDINPAEREKVVDALVRPWDHYTEPYRDNNEPFRRGDIKVKKVTLVGFSYDIYVCVPWSTSRLPEISVKTEGERVSVASAFKDNNALPLYHSYMSVMVNKGTILAARKGIYPHDYERGLQPYVAMPDIEGLPNVVPPSHVGVQLKGRSIDSVIIMCGFGRLSTINVEEANIAVFTKPKVK